MTGGVMFAELHVLSGERREDSDLVGVATSPVLSFFKRRRGQLFTILEPSLPDADAVCKRLIESIEDEYFRDPSRSVTASLRQAIAVANDKLRAENSRTTPDHQLRVGLCCAVVRDGDAYIAQVAPANAFILHEGTVKRIFSTYSVIPDVSSNGGDRASDSLGSSIDPHVNLAYSTLMEGDLVVLASGAYWKLVPDRYIQDAARHMDPEMAASELYGCYLGHARRPTTSVIVVRVSDLPAKQQRTDQRGKTPETRGAVVEMAEMNSASEPQRQPPNGRRRPSAYEEPPRRSWDPPEQGSGGSYSGSSDRGAGSRYPGLSGRGSGGRYSGQPDRGTGGLPSGQSGQSSRSRTRAGQGRNVPVARGRTSLWERLFPKRKPKLPLYPPGPPLEAVGKPSVRLKSQWPDNWGERRRFPTPWAGRLLLMLVLAALFALVGNAAINGLRSWQLGDPVALAQEAQQKRTLATTAQDQAAARVLLSESSDLYSRSLKAKEDEATRKSATAVQDELDRIDKVVRINQATPLVDYSALADDKGDVTQMVIDGNNLYVLDEGQDRAFKYILNADGKSVQEPGKHPVLFKRGDKQDGGTVGDILSLAWMPAGQLRNSPALFALESGRSIVTYDPKAGLSRLEVSDSQKWGTIQAISGFAGGLYLLDTKLKGIFYYPPTKNGYESEPYTIVDARAKVDLAKAVDIALDGNLYVLEGSGTIKRFNREGRPFDFVTDLPDGQVKGPRALFASANTRSVYLLDTVGERVLQLSPEGKLQRQFKAGSKDVSFKDARDIFVDEAGRKLYLLARKSLTVFDMPPLAN
jgi:hypothetical protein